MTFCTPVGRFNHGATVKLSDLTRFVAGREAHLNYVQVGGGEVTAGGLKP